MNGGVMQLTNKEIKRCLHKARDMRELCLYGRAPQPVMSVDALLRETARQLEVPIIVNELELPWDERNQSVRAFVVRKDNGHYEINLLDGQDYSWRRFVLCKELFNCLIDTPQFRSMELYAHIEDMMISIPRMSAEICPATAAEWLAVAAAMEFCFPYQRRIDVLRTGEFDFVTLANMHKIPRIYVEEYLSDQMMERLEEFG